MNTFDEYQAEALKTDRYPRVFGHHGQMLPVYPAMAMCGEAGEFAEKIKKAWRDEVPLDKILAMKELGDVLWYIAAAARELGCSLAIVARMNIDKLRSRRERGVLAGSGDDR